jgi:hypothetical protein
MKERKGGEGGSEGRRKGETKEGRKSQRLQILCHFYKAK